MKPRSILAVMLVVLWALTAAAGGSARPAHQSASDRFLIRTTSSQKRFGQFSERTANPPRRLRALYGEPTGQKHNFGGAGCVQRWKPLGMTVKFAVFGSDQRDPCEHGVFLQAAFRSRRWHTDSGVRPHGRASRARRAAVKLCGPHQCVLHTHQSDCAGARVPSVVAKLDGARVSRIVVSSFACE